MLYLDIILQIFCEIIPISSSLILEINNFYFNKFILHFISGIFFIFFFFKQIFFIFFLKDYKKIFFYFLSTLPSIGIYFLIEKFSFLKIENKNLKIIFNILSAIILLFIFYKNNKEKKFSYNLWNGFSMGFYTSINGVLPGLSRLGTSLSYLIFKGYNLKESYEISMISSIPILLGQYIMYLLKKKEEIIFFKNYICTYKYVLIIIFFIFYLLFFIFFKFFIKKNIFYIILIFRIIFFSFILIKNYSSIFL